MGDASPQFYRALIDNAFEALLLVDEKGKVLFSNRTAEDLLASPASSLVGTCLADLVHPEDLSAVQEAFTQVLRQPSTKSTYAVARVCRIPRGAYVHVEIRGRNFLSDPNVAGIAVSLRDVTASNQVSAALMESEQRLELALHGSGLGLWDWFLRTDELVFDEELGKLLGLHPATFVTSGAELLAHVHPDDLPSVQDAIAAQLSGETRHLEHEYRLLREDGSCTWVFIRGKVVERDPEGTPQRMTGTILNVEERHQLREERAALEEQLQQAQKMESVGQLAGGIAHDFNNILQVILAQARFAVDEPNLSEDVLEALADINAAGQRAAELTRQLLAFGRRQSITPDAVQLNEVLEQSLSLLRRLLPESIVVDFIPGHHLATAFVDVGQFNQVIMNLCVNARDAMPEGGRLTIETENVVINGEYRKKHPWARAGRYLLVAVTDTGSGMTPEIRRRAFDPFYTTKDPSRGTGLGLAMVHGIVRQHGGLIHLYSEVGVGTTFKIYWPSVERAATTVGTKLEGPVPRGQETILVVEDEPSVRRLAARILEAAGYRVMTACDGAEGVEIFSTHHEEIDALLLDAVMPKLSGRKVYETIRRTHRTPVLFTSGYSAASLPPELLASEGLEVLPKPYPPDLLLRMIRTALDNGPRIQPLADDTALES